MEYLLVRFGDEDRAVVIDGVRRGRTNHVLEVEKGTHKISLSPPPSDFTPSEIKVILKKTTTLKHRRVSGRSGKRDTPSRNASNLLTPLHRDHSSRCAFCLMPHSSRRLACFCKK